MVSNVTSFDSEVNSEATNISQMTDFLKNHEEMEIIIPVLCGLYITSQFQLRGANALLVNLAVASVFRSVFKQLKNPTQTIDVTPVSETPQPANSNLFGEGISIVHSVPGRVRLRIEQLRKDAIFAKRLERLLNNEDCVINVRINRTASSVVINYDQGEWSDLDLGLKLMSILNNARSEESQSEVTLVNS
jgi:hypothetical protein